MNKMIPPQVVKDSNDIEDIVRDIGTSPLDESFPNQEGDIFIDNIDDLSNFIGEMS
jgi:hypothetical protein